MPPFPLSRRKLNKLPSTIIHRCVRDWLRKCYEEFLLKDWSVEEKKLFYQRYNQAGKSVPLKLNFDLDLPVLEVISELFHFHQSFLNFGMREHDFLPSPIQQGDDTAEFEAKFEWRVLLDNVRSSFNVGSVIRSTDHAGWSGVLAVGNTPGPNHIKTKKTAMGADEWIPYQHMNSADIVGTFKNYPLIAVDTFAEAANCFEYEWPAQGILVMGNEEYGISNDILKLCTDRVKIPNFGKKNSLNIASAFAVVSGYISYHLTS